MIKSMTGFGTATIEKGSVIVSVEIKSLNSKFLDANFKLPRNFSDRDIELRNLLNQSLERGKINLTVDIQRTGEVKPKVSLNRPLVKAYYQDLTALAGELGTPTQDCFRLALQMPEVYNYEATSEEARQESLSEWETIKSAVETALAECNRFREQEGETLEEKFLEYIGAINSTLQRIEVRDPERIIAVRERLQKNVADFIADEHFDQNRFEQELIYYIEKYDISEEKVRLKTHLDYFLEVLESQDANGKKLNFIAQEIGREINTIGSKANDALIQRYVITMKEELEKIKEQSLNIL